MVGQQISSEKVNNQIAETHAAALAEFEMAKMQMAELKQISAEVNELLRDLHSKIK
jgi:predicted transglutaminase-like cysteine proteinase